RAQVPEPIAQSLQRIQSESARMGGLVDDLLLLARLDDGRPLERDDVDLTRLAIDTIADAQAAGPDHHWQLELPDDPLEITRDTPRMHQLIANLLTNARAHTPPGTNVTLAVLPNAHDVQISVTDDGPGVPPQIQPAVFERFTRADAARGHANGSTGLGL